MEENVRKEGRERLEYEGAEERKKEGRERGREKREEVEVNRK